MPFLFPLLADVNIPQIPFDFAKINPYIGGLAENIVQGATYGLIGFIILRGLFFLFRIFWSLFN